MPRRRNGEPPAYLLHSTGQAYSFLDGRRYYHGEYGSPASRQKYAAFLRKWERERGKLQRLVDDAEADTIREAVARYLVALDDVSEIEAADITRNLNSLAALFGDYHLDDFRPAQLREIRDTWRDAGHVRKTINKEMGRIRRFFRWAVREELAAPDTYARLLAEPNIKRSKRAPDNAPVVAVSEADYLATLPELSPRLRAMVQLQFLCGARPGEVCRINGAEIHRSGSVRIGRSSIAVPSGVWLWFPPHKTERLEKVVVYTLGPQAQAVLTPWLRDGFLFSPAEQRQEQYQRLRTDQSEAAKARRKKRRAQRPGLRFAGETWTAASYGKAVKAAAERAGVPHWHPHQLRHAFVTRTTALAGLLAASAAVSHSSPDVTMLYLDRQIQEVARLAAEHG